MFNKIRNQRGNAFLIVMLGIVLFAGLSFMVSRGMQSETTHKMGARETRLAAAEIIEYAAKVERAVNRLRRLGCSISDISFDLAQNYSKEADDTDYDYTNASSPGDFTCHIFHPSGGNLTPKLPVPSKAAMDVNDVATTTLHPQSFKITATKVEGNGTDAGALGTDLIMQVGRLKAPVCQEINNVLNLTLVTNPPVDVFDCGNNIFVGTFANCVDSIGNSVAELDERTAFCVNDGTYNTYVQVLVPR